MEQGKVKIFIDASVLFAASYSPAGAASEIIRCAQRGEVALVVNKYVIVETEKNLAKKYPQALLVFANIRKTIPFTIANPTRSEIMKMKPHTALKDAPHFATAIKAKVYCLVSLDRKHMINIRNKVLDDLGIRILLPSECLREIRDRVLAT